MSAKGTSFWNGLGPIVPLPLPGSVLEFNSLKSPFLCFCQVILTDFHKIAGTSMDLPLLLGL